VSSTKSSYAQILKSSSIIGGAQGVNYLIGMARVKVIAVLLGPAGVGLIGLYQSATSFLGILSGFGISFSGSREVAEVYGNDAGDLDRIARTIKTLRRVCWVTGMLGWLLTIAFAKPLSIWVFGTDEHAKAIAILGGSLLLSDVSGGQTALLQGMRRIGDLARINVATGLIGTVVAIALYAWLGERGIVPALLSSAGVGLLCSWWFVRKVPVAAIKLPWLETWKQARRLLGLGLAFMWSALLTTIVALMIRAMIVRVCGLEANGIYQAVWGLSGMFAGFVLGAMGADFFPRLTAVAQDGEKANHLINEQTEIGMLLALPGLLATLCFAPWVMRIFYSAKFLSGAELIPWIVFGVFGKVVSWPLGYLLMAKGESKWFAATETSFGLGHLALSVLLIHFTGLRGVAVAFAILYTLYTIYLLGVARRLTWFRWSPDVHKLLFLSGLLLACGAFVVKFVPQGWAEGLGFLLTLVAGLLCLRGIVVRLGSEHRIVGAMRKIPGFELLCKIN